MTFLDAKKRKLSNEYDSTNFFLETYNYDAWFENDESTDTKTKSDLPLMPPTEDNEDVNEGNSFKILPLNQLIFVQAILPVLFGQIKAGNNLYKLKNEIRKTLCLLYQHNKITKNVYSKLIKSL